MTVQRIPIYINDFSDGVQDLPVLSGAGSVSETGGALVVSASTSQNLDWWSTYRNGKLPYIPISLSDNYTRIYYEFTIRSWTTANTSVSALVVALFQNDMTLLWFLYSQDGLTFNVYKNWNTSSLGSIVTTLPRKFRFVWDPYDFKVTVQCLTTESPPTWTTVMAAQTIGMTPIGLGFSIKNWNTFPACTAQYEDTEIYAENFQMLDTDPFGGIEDSLVFPSPGPSVGSGGGGIGLNGAGPTQDGWQNNEPLLGFEDAGRLLSAGGSPDPMSGIPDGVFIPEPSGLEDTVFLPNVGGTPDWVTGIPEGSIPSNPKGGAEDSSYIEATAPTYAKEVNDVDGRETLSGSSVRQVYLYDASQDPWYTHGADYYGAAQNGKCYYNGVECGPGAFSVSGIFNDTAWSRPGGYLDAISTAKDSEISVPLSGTVRFTSSAAGGFSYTQIRSTLRWFLTGDFDIQLDYNIVSVGFGPGDGGIIFEAYIDPNNYFYVRRKIFGGGRYDKDVRNNGGWTSYAFVSTSDTSGSMRLTRTGSVVRSYYWNGASWTQIGSDFTMTYNRPMWVNVGYSFNLIPTVTVLEVSRFIINSGATTNLIGWAREVAGTYRGTLAAFPPRALLASSGNGFDILDADTQKLWMSFRSATSNLVGGDANFYIRQIVAKDGVLFVAYRNFDSLGTANGWVAWIDFTVDSVRLVRGPTQGDGGLIYNVELSTGIWPKDASNGCIAFRNSARGYMASFNADWAMQHSRGNWCDLLHDSGFQYRALANNGGAMIQKWKRWRFEGFGNQNWSTPDKGISTKTTAMKWLLFNPTTKALYYHDRSQLHVANFATWSAVLSGAGGTWIEDNSYNLSGSVDSNTAVGEAQDKMMLYDGYLWYPRVNGVYRIDPGIGISMLYYGMVGSGAVQEILPDYTTVASIHQSSDGTTAFLAIGIQFIRDKQSCDQVVLVDISTDTIYGVGAITKGRTTYAMAV